MFLYFFERLFHWQKIKLKIYLPVFTRHVNSEGNGCYGIQARLFPLEIFFSHQGIHKILSKVLDTVHCVRELTWKPLYFSVLIK